MSDMSDDDAEALRDFLSLMRGIHEDQTIARAELGLMDTADHSPVPMPNEAHPSLARYADTVRSSDPRRMWSIQVPKMHRAAFAMPGDDAPTAALASDRVTLTAKKLAGPAPFVGDPRREQAMYVWFAWVDDIGRSITGDAELVRRERWA